MMIGDNSVVSIHYKLTDNDENVIDTSEGAEPLTYLHGVGNLIPGLEKELVGKVENDALTVKVQPADGYGDVVEELVESVPKTAFQGVDNIEVGMSFEAQNPNGDMQRIVVKKVDGDMVTVDANHPLAGVELNFDVTIISVREATEEEIAHGHVH
ncbi:MAG: peptidylprolyl isomerase [Gammaproteobacteria bacterium]|nr:MAG: peptidylprolyl isomerase [Gammaproteobacteria bacterium]